MKKHDLTVSQYLQKAKSLADELAAAGRPLSNAEFNAIIYRNLGYEYHSIITALNQRPTPVTFQELHGQLVAHEVLIKGLHEPPVANLTIRNFSASQNRRRPPSSMASSSSTNFQQRPFTTYRKPRGPCQICGYNCHDPNPGVHDRH